MTKIHKVADDTAFRLRAKCGVYPADEAHITEDDSKVTCKRCKRKTVRGPNEWD